MTANTHRDGSPDDAPTDLSDPATLRDDDAVAFRESTAVADAEHFENHAEWDGMAIVGVTDDAGRLLLLRNEDDHAILPHRAVEPGDDYAAVAREATEEAVDLAVEIEAVERVRHVRYRLGDDESRRTERYDVLFHAVPRTDATPSSDRDCWRTVWADEAPENPDWDHENVLEDIRLFLD
jgi:hypothetical protein